MNQNKYLLFIKELNGPCNCKDLSKLFFLEKKAKNLANNCDSLLESLQEIHQFNSEVHYLYDQKILERNNCYSEHFEELNSLIKKEKLKLFYHNKEDNYKKQLVIPNKAIELLKEKKIITIHCYNCDQQVGLVINNNGL